MDYYYFFYIIFTIILKKEGIAFKFFGLSNLSNICKDIDDHLNPLDAQNVDPSILNPILLLFLFS